MFISLGLINLWRQVLEVYDWVINSFVLDFFLDSHWPHLPSPWRATLTQASPQSIARSTPFFWRGWGAETFRVDADSCFFYEAAHTATAIAEF